MKRSRVGFVAVMVLLVAAFVLPACAPQTALAESYLAVAPSVWPAQGQESVSVSLFRGGKLVTGTVEVSLLQDGRRVTGARQEIRGKGQVRVNLPDLQPGDYTLEVKGPGFNDRAQVRVEKSLLLFLETDKPIYKPGQTIHMRALTLNSELRPVSERLTLEAQDAKGIKVFRKEVASDDYGLANLDLPLSNEPNLGVWKISASSQEARTELDVRVEEYVLPKYEVKVELPKEWFLVSEPVTGTIKAEYSFGKPVRGTLSISALRYVGQWQEYQTFTRELDGETDFELRPVGYVAGVPEARGMGNVMLQVSVEERSTGYLEKTTRLLTVSESPLSLQIIPEGLVFKPGLPFNLLIITETPDNTPVEAPVQVTVSYFGTGLNQIGQEQRDIQTEKGKALVEIAPPKDSIGLNVQAQARDASAQKSIEAGYSPTGSFIHVEQISGGTPSVGDDIVFRVNATREAVNFYYEVVSRGKVVFTGHTTRRDIVLTATPQMAPSSKLLVYQILPTSEVAADYLPFQVTGDYPQQVEAGFSQDQVRPGDDLDVIIKTEGPARVGLVAVDRSVFILAENRLNLQQVFDELERLYMEPRVEVHEITPYSKVVTQGASETFQDAGVVVLTNNKVPEGKEYQGEQPRPMPVFGFAEKGGPVPMPAATPIPTVTPAPKAPQAAQDTATGGLAEVQRLRQYFPETWLWEEVMTDAQGNASVQVRAPDTITTWMLRAVALSKENGLGIAEGQLQVFQPFFIKVDLPYSAIRGEEFPVKVAVYNYLDREQQVRVEVKAADWFDLLDVPAKTVNVAPNDIGGVEFQIRPRQLGTQGVEVSARTTTDADAVVKTLLVEPEGVKREVVENLVLSAGGSTTADTSVPFFAVAESGRAYVAVTASYLAQTIEGLEQLLEMPFGCGEQNMILFAPDVYITQYLKETNQLKPEIMAKAEKLMITGYQRELTYRRSDGSFSAFGESDEVGSLWLTAFVLKTFAQARNVVYIDQSVLDEAARWIAGQQRADGSFESVGFVHHQEMMGGVQGKNALTAYVAIALWEAGETSGAARAVRYLEGQLADIDDPYTMAITAYALELAGSGARDQAQQKLMDMAQADENGLHWGDNGEIVPLPQPQPGIAAPMRIMPPQGARSTQIEATAYATLALLKHGDVLDAGRAAQWLVSKRNAYGGYGSTQDTVVALEALTQFSKGARADVDLTVNIAAGGQTAQLSLNTENFDVLQVVQVPVDAQVQISAQGRGQAVAQVVTRYNLPEVEDEGQQVLKVNVTYSATEVEVNDLVHVSAEMEFNPPEPVMAGMVVLDISVPTGFAPVRETLAAVVDGDKRIKRYEVAGRKVIFYIEDMAPGERVALTFDVLAQYPVRAKGTTSQAYSYYQPELRGETLGSEMTVR